MDLSESAKCEPKAVYKQSDFSIDHILNRAGVKSEDKHEYSFMNNCEQIKNRFNRNCIPMFSWLQYTRYRPPKLQRSIRVGPVKRTPGRLPRVPFTPTQLSCLENAYKRSSYLSAEDANRLADNLELSSTRVKIWFQNRRARERRENKETSDDTLDLSISQNQCDYLHSDIKYEIYDEKS